MPRTKRVQQRTPVSPHQQVDEDIFAELPIRTQTGPLSIPVVCTARRVKPKLSTTLVVFRGTVMGEKEVRTSP